MPASPADPSGPLGPQPAAEMKSCPDCAELVRGEARKCRYCGYRFDEADQPAGGSGLLELMGLRKTRRKRSLSELLGAWGLRLGQQEQVILLAFASRERRSGYLLLTDERLCFFAMPKAEKLVELPLSGLGGVRALRKHGRRVLRIEGGGRVLTFTHLRGAQERAVLSYLQERLSPSEGAPAE